MNSNGVLSFDGSFTNCCPPRNFPRFSSPLIAPYWHDFDPSRRGTIYHRQTRDPALLQRIHTLLSNVDARDLSSFFPTQLFIATWDRVAPHRNVGLITMVRPSVEDLA